MFDALEQLNAAKAMGEAEKTAYNAEMNKPQQ